MTQKQRVPRKNQRSVSQPGLLYERIASAIRAQLDPDVVAQIAERVVAEAVEAEYQQAAQRLAAMLGAAPAPPPAPRPARRAPPQAAKPPAKKPNGANHERKRAAPRPRVDKIPIGVQAKRARDFLRKGPATGVDIIAAVRPKEAIDPRRIPAVWAQLRERGGLKVSAAGYDREGHGKLTLWKLDE